MTKWDQLLLSQSNGVVMQNQIKHELPFDVNENQSIVQTFQYSLVRRKLAVLSTVALKLPPIWMEDGKWDRMGKLALKKKALNSVF